MSADAAAVAIRRLGAADWAIHRSLRLRALDEDPDAFGSTLAREAARTDAFWQARAAEGAAAPDQLPLLAFVAGRPAGLLWAHGGPPRQGTVDIYSMWVAGEARGRGVANALLDAVLTWAAASGNRCVRLEVTVGDSPARRLYERAGFVAVGAPSPLRPDTKLRSQRMEIDPQSMRP